MAKVTNFYIMLSIFAIFCFLITCVNAYSIYSYHLENAEKITNIENGIIKISTQLEIDLK